MWSPKFGSKRSSRRVSRSTKRHPVRHSSLQIGKRLLRFERGAEGAACRGRYQRCGKPLTITTGGGQVDALTIELNAAKTFIDVADTNGNTYTLSAALIALEPPGAAPATWQFP